MDQSKSSDERIRLRRSLRLKDYDYASAGAYFVTVCTHDRQGIFGEILNGEMTLNKFGQIAQNQWHQLPKRFENIELDAFIVMPDHIHGILFIIDQSRVGAGFTPARENIGQPRGLPLRRTIGDIVGTYKSLVAHECLKICKAKNEVMGKLWQRNYYEHIIGDEGELNKIRMYIEGNPLQPM